MKPFYFCILLLSCIAVVISNDFNMAERWRGYTTPITRTKSLIKNSGSPFYFVMCIRTNLPKKCKLYTKRVNIYNRHAWCYGCQSCGKGYFLKILTADQAKSVKNMQEKNGKYNCVWVGPNENGWVSSKYNDKWKFE